MAFDRVILGENCVYSTDCQETGVNNNVLVCGGTGSGKTVFFVEPRLLETYNSSLITIVTKRRLVKKYKPLFSKRGYEVQDLNFVHPLEGDIGFDPLNYVQDSQDIRCLAESIVLANPKKKENTSADPYWDQAAVSLLIAEIAYTMMTKSKATFADVLDMHYKLDFSDNGGEIKTSYDSKFDYLGKNDPNCLAVNAWKSFRKLPIRTASCVFGTLNTVLDSIFTPELRKMMVMKRKVDFERLASRKTILFITSSPVNPALNYFINMFYSQAFKSLFEFAEGTPDGTLPVPVHVICDDFATGGKILHFEELISIFREKKISVSLLLQSESQLQSMYGSNEATTIINNCDTYLYLGGNDLQTANNVSLRLNAPLDEVLYMPIGKLVAFRRGQRPITTNRYNIFQDEQYQELTKEYEKKFSVTER